MSNEGSHVWAKFYYWDKKSPPIQVSVTLDVQKHTANSVIDAAVALAEKAIEKGLYADYPSGDANLESGQSLVDADSVIRRHFVTRKDNQEADVLDFYIDGLEHRVNYWYINNDRDKAYLEHATGLVFDAMPVVEQDTPLSRMQI